MLKAPRLSVRRTLEVVVCSDSLHESVREVRLQGTNQGRVGANRDEVGEEVTL